MPHRLPRTARCSPSRTPVGWLVCGLLLLPVPASAIEAGGAIYSSFPLLLGVEVGVGSHLRWEAAVGGGFTPALYVNVIQALADSQESSDVISGTLDHALGIQANGRIFPKAGFGLYLTAGYDLLRVNGQIDASQATTGQALREEPDTGSDLPPGGGGTGGAGGVNPPPISRPPEPTQISATIQALHLGLGYRQFLKLIYLQAELTVLKAFATAASPVNLQEYLRETYTKNLLIPTLSLAVGVRF